MTDRSILVIHEIGDSAGGAPWREAFGGDVHAPDLPGHGGAPAPVSGHYEVNEAAVVAAGWIVDRPAEVVVGVGASGWPAEMLALSGRVEALVLVDGLGGPWADPVAVIDEGVEWARAILADPDAVSPPPTTGPDPRLRHGVPRMRSRSMAERAAAAVSVPTLIVETPASPLAVDDVEHLAGCFAGGAEVVRVDSSSHADIAGVVRKWV